MIDRAKESETTADGGPASAMETADAGAAGATDATIGMWTANAIGLGILPLIGISVLGPFLALWGTMPLHSAFRDITVVAIFIPAFLAAVAAHEGLHALAYRYAGGAGWDSIRFGVNWKALAPYAHCMSAMSARAYRIAVSLPGVLLGAIPALLAWAVGDGRLAVWGFLMVAAAGGDIAILWAIRRVPGHAHVRDHPTRAGCEIVREGPGR